jgi:hypothetical protein
VYGGDALPSAPQTNPPMRQPCGHDPVCCSQHSYRILHPRNSIFLQKINNKKGRELYNKNIIDVINMHFLCLFINIWKKFCIAFCVFSWNRTRTQKWGKIKNKFEFFKINRWTSYFVVFILETVKNVHTILRRQRDGEKQMCSTSVDIIDLFRQFFFLRSNLFRQ